jgi:hypothetical protein
VIGEKFSLDMIDFCNRIIVEDYKVIPNQELLKVIEHRDIIEMVY